jgi:hypothetical protein
MFAASAVLVMAWPAQALATSMARAGTIGLADPPTNIPRTQAMSIACSSGPTLACQQAVVHAISQARAAEGVGPLVLPSYYDSLKTAEQLMVLADLERVDRGLPGFTGLSSQLDHLAQKAALSNSDPVGPAGSTWGSNWAGGETSALLADYDWMYNDGPGSSNQGCGSASGTRCWAHRRNVLASYGRHPSIGTGVAVVNGSTSMTELFSSAPAGHLDYALPTKKSTQEPALLRPAHFVRATSAQTSTEATPNSGTAVCGATRRLTPSGPVVPMGT